MQAVTSQNEIDTDQDGRMPACCWPQEVEIAFVRDHLGPRLAKAAHPADIWLLDHNYNLWGRVVCELEDPELRKHAKGVAWHGYGGRPEQMLRVKDAFPDVDMFWTEGGPNWEKGDYFHEWARWGDTITGILRNQVRAVIGWNYALDEKGTPNIGPFACAGLVTVDSKTRQIAYSAQSWAFWHFSSHIRRHARIVESSGAPGIAHVAAKNPDGGMVAVLTNRAQQPVTTTVTAREASVVRARCRRIRSRRWRGTASAPLEDSARVRRGERSRWAAYRDAAFIRSRKVVVQISPSCAFR